MLPLILRKQFLYWSVRESLCFEGDLGASLKGAQSVKGENRPGLLGYSSFSVCILPQKKQESLPLPINQTIILYLSGMIEQGVNIRV